MRGHLSHPVTGMNRPAPRGLLQSGCTAAWARGLHRSPLAWACFAVLALSRRFSPYDKDIISFSPNLSRTTVRFFAGIRHGSAGENAYARGGTFSAADAMGGAARPPIENPEHAPQPCCQKQQKPDLEPVHSSHRLSCMLLQKQRLCQWHQQQPKAQKAQYSLRRSRQ